jgi:hypothetical protein
MKAKSIVAGSVLVLSLLVTYHAFSQSSAPVDPMDQGSWVASVGIGPGTHIFSNGVGFGPGIKLFAENGTFQLGPGVLSLGGEFGLSFFSYKYFENYKASWVNIMFGARSAYHYGWKVPGLDTYGGLPLGIGFSIYHYTHYYRDLYVPRGYSAVYPYFGVFVGASYFFNKIIGLNGELGYNVTYANIGVILKVR